VSRRAQGLYSLPCYPFRLLDVTLGEQRASARIINLRGSFSILQFQKQMPS